MSFYKFGFLLTLALFVAGVCGIWLGWNGNEPQRIDWMGYGTLLMGGVMALFGAGELINGPLRNLTVRAGPVEVDLEGDRRSPRESEHDLSH